MCEKFHGIHGVVLEAFNARRCFWQIRHHYPSTDISLSACHGMARQNRSAAAPLRLCRANREAAQPPNLTRRVIKRPR